MLVVVVEAVQVTSLAGPLAHRAEGSLAQQSDFGKHERDAVRARQKDLILALLCQKCRCRQTRHLRGQPIGSLRPG